MTNTVMTESFCQFGSVYYEPLDLEQQHLACMQFSAQSKTIEQLYCFPHEVCIELISGLAVILLSARPGTETPSAFTIHHYLRLKPGVFFNVVPISAEASYSLITPESRFKQYPLLRPYTLQHTPVQFHILEIFDCYHSAEEPPCRFHKATHEYYELLYVTQGMLSVARADNAYALTAGDAILLGPDTKHPKLLQRERACSYLSVVFDMEIAKPYRLLGRIFHCTGGLRDALRRLTEDCATHTAHTRTLMICHMQEVLTHLLLFCDPEDEPTLSASSPTYQNDLLQQILTYMEERVTEPITIEEICHKFFLSRSSLQSLFKTHLNNSPKSYLLNIKLQKSKELIRENQHTISEIAELLGFSSIHYFSRLFKKYFEQSPSEYAKQVFQEEDA